MSWSRLGSTIGHNSGGGSVPSWVFFRWPLGGVTEFCQVLIRAIIIDLDRIVNYQINIKELSWFIQAEL